ncbi:DUF2809 domain-containing protein [Roseiarcaceae bacterium H3SJ34-1]|uniref:ribosomal maturation YjgA family protein n=1 Tax=Terripilifer ovatus TaxID=3032367 RepID=UPI003AB9B35C|nr:DUF2809 domain-containing protein [Roseiarcaceae bacterium H3SJ34-1]
MTVDWATIGRRAGLCLVVIICGLVLRGFGYRVGLPFVVVKYGGSVLWGTALFLFVAICASRQPLRNVAWISIAIAICVELSRLVHTPWLDAFRLTLPGALLLGRIFSPCNMPAYGLGIALGAALAKWRDRRV